MKTKPQPPAQDLDTDTETDLNSLEIASEPAGAPATPPEVTPETESIIEWDTPPESTGTSHPHPEAEDEPTIGQKLTEAGLEEADRDRRLAAADPDYEP